MQNPMPSAVQPAQKLLASRLHTAILFGIVAVLLIVGVFNASQHITAKLAPTPGQTMKLALTMIAMQWMWVYFVYKGMRAHGRSILEFLGLGSLAPAKLAVDCAYAALAFAILYASSQGIDRIMPDEGSAGNNPFLASFPQGYVGAIVWILLSITAGVCEEIVFRGYLQRQLIGLTGSVGLGIVLQALTFGIGHAYEGANSVVSIAFHGLVLGLIAYRRGNIRAGIIVHAGWDILAGFGFI
jgi:membrane protease YdiL (CAAX protease family)